MKRIDLKFKVWDNEKKRMSKEFTLGSFCIQWNDGDVEMPTPFAEAKINRFEFLQFTTLRDKNGVEILEGSCFKDVLNSELIGVVRFGEYVNCFDEDRLRRFGGHCGFYVDFKKGYVRNDLKYWAKNSEVIGNIYENPELLQVCV